MLVLRSGRSTLVTRMRYVESVSIAYCTTISSFLMPIMCLTVPFLHVQPLAKELSVIVERIGKVSGADISLVVAKLIQSHPYDKFRGDISQELATIFPNLTEPRMYQVRMLVRHTVC